MEYSHTRKRLRVLVCGSRFGQFYLEALKLLSDTEFEIAGLFAKGSERSKIGAQHYGVELFTDIDCLPQNIDLACVVIRSSVMGGEGTKLAVELMSRGISVLLEHPVHHQDISMCIKTANKYGVYFHIGNLYLHLDAPRTFFAAAGALLSQMKISYLNADFSSHVSFPFVALLVGALQSVRPMTIADVQKNEGPFQTIIGKIGTILFSFRVHNQVAPNDSDNYLYLFHEITLGTESGSLSMETHGPVVWKPRMHIPNNINIPWGLKGLLPEHLLEPSQIKLDKREPEEFSVLLGKRWPEAVGADIEVIAKQIWGETSRSDTLKQQQRLILAAQQWQVLTGALGYPDLIKHAIYDYYPASLLQNSAIQPLNK